MWEENLSIYIYGLVDPFTEEVRYVGKTVNLYERFYNHLQEMEDPIKHNYHSKNWLRSVLKKGKVPKLAVLELCDTETWQEREMFWISYYKTLGNNLTNMTKGGDGGGMLGKPSPKRTKVDVYTITGELVKTFDSLTAAEEYTGVHNGKIAAICKRKDGRKSGKGFVFRYQGEPFSYEETDRSAAMNHIKKEIYELNYCGDIVNTYTHAIKASEFSGVERSNISFVCNHPYKKDGNLRICGDRYFCYKENYKEISTKLNENFKDKEFKTQDYRYEDNDKFIEHEDLIQIN